MLAELTLVSTQVAQVYSPRDGLSGPADLSRFTSQFPPEVIPLRHLQSREACRSCHGAFIRVNYVHVMCPELL